MIPEDTDSKSVGFVITEGLWRSDLLSSSCCCSKLKKSNKELLYPLRFLVGNKSDLRGALSAGCQVHQERARSFARAHNMMFFETSAKSPPSKTLSGGQSRDEAPFQQDLVEDIVISMGAKLKRQKRPSAGDPPAYSGSFKVTSTRNPEKEPYVCC